MKVVSTHRGSLSIVFHLVIRLLILSFLLLPVTATAQTVPDVPFSVELVERPTVEAPALHSSAVATWNGRWLFLGGRTNGLHGFGSSPFPPRFENAEAIVYDPALDRRWTAPLATLPDSVAAVLRATNTQFHQDGRMLYIVGGYGYDPAMEDHRTYPTLTAVDVPGLIEAVVAGTALAPHLRQIVDERLAVTGGHLLRLDGRYYLLGGHRFDGIYLDGHSPRQQYTDAVRSFVIVDDGVHLAIEAFEEVQDAGALHRRDGNAAGVRYADGTDGLAIYGGVFTPEDRAYKTPVYVGASGIVEDTSFKQRIGHYTCPVLPVFDGATGAMHTVFFGGMGEDYVDTRAGVWRSDARVPFIDEVAVTTRAADGTTAEVLLPLRMPGFLGTNAAFIPADGVARTQTGVVLLEELDGRTLVGYIHGGIEATDRHPGVLGIGASVASARLFEVYLQPLGPLSKDAAAPAPAHFTLSAPAPSPSRTSTRLTLTLSRPGTVDIQIVDVLGRVVLAPPGSVFAAGTHEVRLDVGALPAGVYFVRARMEDAVAVRSFVHLP